MTSAEDLEKAGADLSRSQTSAAREPPAHRQKQGVCRGGRERERARHDNDR
jgi:hypothetical protein